MPLRAVADIWSGRVAEWAVGCSWRVPTHCTFLYNNQVIFGTNAQYSVADSGKGENVLNIE